MKNKRGWIKVLEVFVSILLIMGIIVLLLNETYFESGITEEVSSMQISILREIQFDDNLRGNILSASLPTNWSEFNSTGLGDVREKISNETIPSLDCEARVCALTDVCKLENDLNKDIYAEAVVISADSDIYSPRQLKLFCWEK